MDLEDSLLPLSQMANEAFESNPALRQPIVGPTSFRGIFSSQGTTSQPTDVAEGSSQLESASVVHGKLINDPIHGAYRLDAACTTIFDTRQFQRLRRLKQLGLTYFVFPGASHNRFEHSLGVAHLAYKFANVICQAQRAELEVERSDLKVVELAGLCHDLGHGPFSHVFEREFLRRKGITDWEHEDMSSKMLEHIIDANCIDSIATDDIRRVQGLITAGHTGGTTGKHRWLGEIVANGRNGIDVDKFDYLARDSMYCGVKISCDFNRIMQFSKVIDDEICYKYTEYMNLYELFHSRASMHRHVYTHKKAKAVEYMVVDALIAADPVLKISEKIWKPADFVQLDDGLLEIIENFEMFRPMLQLDDDQEDALRESQAIIERMRKRQLYKYVTDALVPKEVLERGQWVPPTTEDIVNSYKGSDVKLRPEDVILQENKIDYSMKDRNPLDEVHFYDYLYSTEKRKLRPHQISSMVVASFEEKTLRVYSRNGDIRYVRAVHEAFETWIKSRFNGNVSTSTPAKQLRPAPPPKPQQGGSKRARDLFNAKASQLPPRPPSNGVRSQESSPVKNTRARVD